MAAEIDETKLEERLFEGVRFTVIPSADLPADEAQKVPGNPLSPCELRVRQAKLTEYQVKEVLKDGGATYVPVEEDGRIMDLSHVTHIISSTSDFEQYHDALNAYIQVAMPSWIFESVRQQKQANPRHHSPDPCLIFTGQIVTCADIPEGDKEAIAGGVIALGGQFLDVLTKQVTHIVTLSDENEKCQVAIHKHLRCKIVLPHWFDHCFRLRKRISEDPYTFPNPEYRNYKNVDVLPTPRDADITDASSPDGPNEEKENDPWKRRPMQVFKNKMILLGEDLRLGDRLKKVLAEMIKDSGGSVTNNILEANILVCKYRHGDDYITASQEGKTVGNLSWFYHLVKYDMWTSPLRRIMHYPVPKEGIPGFQDMKISVSNYQGEARVYLENLVNALGAEFTKTLRETNTHLITAHDRSEKCEAARDWDIQVLNHLWLEDSYVRCKKQSESKATYTTFPKYTNLGEIIGQMQLDPLILQKIYFPQRPEVQSRLSSLPAPDDLKTSVKSDRTTTVVGSIEQRDDLLGEPTSDLTSLETDAPEELEEPLALQEVDNMDVDELAPTQVQKTRRSTKETPLRTPAVRAVSDEGKENQTPSTTGSRSAKSKAASRLHEQSADIALYNKEMKRKGGVTHGRERRSSGAKDRPDSIAKDPNGTSAARKRKATEIEDDGNETDDSTVHVAPHKGSVQKKAKHDNLPTQTHWMVITGYERWDKNPDLASKEKNRLRNMGIHVTEDSSKVTILLAPKLARTKKFICAIANAPYVVGPSFLEACVKNEKVIDPKDHTLIDRENEEKFGFKLQQALERAKVNNGHLFSGWQIFVTEKVPGGFAIYDSIIKANGGLCTLYKGRTDMNASKRSFHTVGGRGGANNPAAESQGEDEGDTLYFVSGTTKAEVELWGKFKKLATKEDLVPVIADKDWLLTCAMSQEIVWDEEWRLTEESADS